MEWVNTGILWILAYLSQSSSLSLSRRPFRSSYMLKSEIDGKQAKQNQKEKKYTFSAEFST